MTEQAAIDKQAEAANPLPKYQAADTADFVDLYDSALSGYCRQALKSFGYLDNQGMALDDDEGGSGPVHIDSLYVLPKASRERLAPETLAQQEADGENKDHQELLSIVDIIRNTPRLILLGDPGVGKSTLIQWLVCSLCHWNLNYGQKQIGRLFPLVLTARKLTPDNTSRALSHCEFIDTVLKSQGEQLSSLILDNEQAGETFESMLKSGQVLVLVDGLDEISPLMSNWLNKQLRQLLVEYPKSQLLLTSRVVGFDANAFWQVVVNSDGGGNWSTEAQKITTVKLYLKHFGNLPKNYYMAPFNPEQRLQFATNWVTNYLPPNDEKRQQFIADINSISQYSVQLNGLSRIPVLLNLICFIQWRRGKLPNGRAELYQRIVETYLVAMDRSRSIANQLGDEYDYQDIKSWLGQLALQMQAGQLVLAGEQAELAKTDEETLDDLRHQLPKIQDERLLQLSESELSQFLKLQLTEVVDNEQLQLHSEQLITYIKTRTGFLIPRGQIDGEEYYGFSHLSFQEYFAAYAIANALPGFESDGDFTQQLIETTDESAWSEVWQLVFEELSLTGSSRRTIEKQLGLLFANGHSLWETDIPWEMPQSVVLYGKILLNPAVKLAAVKRLERQLALAVDYLQTGGVSHVVMNHLVSDLFAYERTLLVSALSASTVLYFEEIELDDLSWLGSLEQLKHLNLYNVNIKDFTVLANLSQISKLGLRYTNIRDLTPIENLTQLLELSLDHTDIRDLSPLLKLKSLKHLYIGKEIDSDIRAQLEQNGVKVH